MHKFLESYNLLPQKNLLTLDLNQPTEQAGKV